MVRKQELKIIVGLGNPGKAYVKTRHNVGFAAVDLLAAKYRLEFHKQMQFKGELAEGSMNEHPVMILKPLTFMNLSGEAVASLLRYFKIDVSQLMILTDDVALPLGQLRIRINSGSGGHNGLKSIEECLQTDRYPRLRIGVGDRDHGDLSDHVLGRFSEEEETLIPSVLERVVQAVEIWLDKGLTSAMNFSNKKSSSTPSIGEENEET